MVVVVTTMVSRYSVISQLIHIDYKQLLDLNRMLGDLISHWMPFCARRPKSYSVDVSPVQPLALPHQECTGGLTLGFVCSVQAVLLRLPGSIHGTL